VSFERAFTSCGSRSCAILKPWAAAYPHKFAFTHTVPQVLANTAKKGGRAVGKSANRGKVAGRLISIRVQGKAGFAHLQQSGKRLQIYVKLDFVGEKGFRTL